MTRKLVFLSLLLFATCVDAQKHKIKKIAWERVEVTKSLDAHPDAEAVAIAARYKSSVDSVMEPALGVSRIAMSAGRPESLLGNWAADVLVEGSTATGFEPADFGLANVGGLRATMPDGGVRVGDIYLISPFQNKLVVLEMKGKDVLELMHNIVAVGGEALSSSVRIVATRDRVLKSVKIGGEPINPKKIYKVATLDYLAEGNDKMYALKKAVKRHELGIVFRDLMMESIIKHRVIDSKIEGRITVE